jgi:hypothetical protein
MDGEVEDRGIVVFLYKAKAAQRGAGELKL